MIIRFNTQKLAKTINIEKKRRGKYGPKAAAKIEQRLNELSAADTLADMANFLAARCHELTGQFKGWYSVDLPMPYRLVFVPDHDPIPMTEDGGHDLKAITEIQINGILDTH